MSGKLLKWFRTVTPEYKNEIWYPVDHFEVDPVSKVSCTREPSLKEIEAVIACRMKPTTQIINWFRYLDSLPPFGREVYIPETLLCNEMARIEKYYLKHKEEK